MVQVIEKWVNSYGPKTDIEFRNARREIIQEIALSGLNRAGFFDHACFYGGTALRIFYGLDRYSEDLDFSLLYSNKDFTFAPYIPALEEEFNLLGLDAEVIEKKKRIQTAIESAFLKDNTIWSELDIEFRYKDDNSAKCKVKIEIDRDPPLNFSTESLLLNRPVSQYINCMVQKDLFAGKMHAVLFRKWVTNEKGRDWYDLSWYIRNKIELGLAHFNQRAAASGNLNNGNLYNKASLIATLHERIENLNLAFAIKDISRFLKDQRELEVWSKKYFHEIADKLKVV